MRLADFPLFASALDAKRTIGVEKALQALTQGVETGEIANVLYKDTVKYHIGRAFEDAWTALIRQNYTYNGKYQSLTDDERKLECAISYPESHKIVGQIKRIEKAKITDSAMVADMLAILREIAPIGAAVVSLKDKVVKRQPKADADPYERYRAPEASKVAIIQVKRVLTDITAEAYDSLVEALVEHFSRQVNRYIETQKLVVAYYAVNKRDWKFETKEEKLANEIFQNYSMLISKAVNMKTLVLEVNAVETIRAEAVRYADRTRENFIYKNLAKLDSIFDAKGNFKDMVVLGHSISLSGMEAEFRFNFADGSAFSTKLQVVYVRNSYGTEFDRFPLTFHDVVTADGKKMLGPSEQRMNTVFIGK